MSLNWDAKKVEKWEEIPWEKRESAIFATMIVDLGSITETNHVEWYERYTAYNFACGWDNYLSFADVKSMIGLSTNVYPTTPAAHRKRVAKRLQERVREFTTKEMRNV